MICDINHIFHGPVDLDNILSAIVPHKTHNVVPLYTQLFCAHVSSGIIAMAIVIINIKKSTFEVYDVSQSTQTNIGFYPLSVNKILSSQRW